MTASGSTDTFIAAAVFTSMGIAYCYMYWWDVSMVSGGPLQAIGRVFCVQDWGLRPSYAMLRQTTMLPSGGWYYAAIALDCVLRFVWIFSLVPILAHNQAESGSTYSGVVTGKLLFALGAVEVASHPADSFV